MKNKIYLGFLVLALFIVAACDNGNTDFKYLDSTPTVTLGAFSGTIEGETFTIQVSAEDGDETSTISELATLTWSFSNNGGSGSTSLVGNSYVGVITQDGLAAGDYVLTVTVADSNGNSSSESVDIKIVAALFDITGEWRMEPVAGAFKVGPAAGSGEWWQSSDGDVAARACHFDDIYKFNADGSFHIDMQDQTWLETWQGVDPDQCGTPVAPFVSSTDFTYSYGAGSLTLIGQGAAVGLAKVNNEGEISQGAPVADQITYNITSQTDDGTNRRMTLQIEAADGVWWEFLLISGPPAASSIVGTWTMAPIEGAMGVGPTQGSTAWWQNNTDDVTARACFFDDTWTFDANGGLEIDLGTETWVETWQGGGDSCAAPVAPHESGSFSYQLVNGELTVNGAGAYVGIPKATNSGELTAPGDAPSAITYIVSEITDTDMTIQINYNPGGEGWWQFKLRKQ